MVVFREDQWAGNTVWCGVVVFREGQWAGNTVWWCSGKVSGQVTRCGGVQGRSVGR